jgi:hypothetical protein
MATEGDKPVVALFGGTLVKQKQNDGNDMWALKRGIVGYSYD